MLEPSQFKIIVDNLSTGIFVTEKINFTMSGSLVSDKKLKILYANKNLQAVAKNVFAENIILSQENKNFHQENEFIELAEQCGKENQSVTKTIYFAELEKWFTVKCALMEKEMFLFSLQDITSYQAVNEQLCNAAFHDSMTNLLNRDSLNRYIQSVKENPKETFGLILFNIDNLKDTNESISHHAGDKIIRTAAVLLRKMESDDTKAYRFSGDEFILIKRNPAEKKEMEDYGKKLLELFHNENINISGGISLFPQDSESPKDILKFADIAKSEVKKNGKNNLIFFHSLMKEKFLQKINMENKLSKAVANKNFQLYFQPQFDINKGTLRGFEALIRWHDSELGWISPEQFIPLAEEAQIIVPLGDWVLDTALQTLKKWVEDFNFTGILSINVSPLQFKTDDFLENLFDKIDEYEINVENLEIEVTEGIMIDSTSDTISKLQEIRNHGIGISLDDFGTGYSSLRYLQILPLTTLKIDKSFISNINSEESADANITESIIQMVSKMGLDTIAEGVETEGQLETLKKINCTNVQGFLKGRPMPEYLCERFLCGDEKAVLTV